MTNSDSWELDEPSEPKTVGDIRRALIQESGFRPSIVNRGLMRLNDVVADGDCKWVLAGRPKLGDSFPIYTVRLSDGSYDCTCYGHQWGESRQRRLCSHVIAVIVARRLNKVKGKPASQKLQLTPADLGLPAKFGEFRPVQLQGIEGIEASDKPHILLAGPTGTGKTVIPPAIQRLFKTTMLYIPFTIQLQDQFMNDFARDLEGKEWAIKLMGRANYPTLRYRHLFPRINASMCTVKKETHCRWCCDGDCELTHDGKCEAIMHCPSRVQKAKTLSADLANLNFDVFINEANFVGAFSKRFHWGCIDECDQIERGLMGFVELSITRRWIERLGLGPPSRKTVEGAWVDWVQREGLPAVEAELQALEQSYGVEDMRREEELKRMRSKLQFFLSEVGQTKWVFSAEENRWTWKPVFVARYAEKYLWRHAERWLLISATIISPGEMCHTLGIPRDQADFIDLPSTFAPEHKPTYYLPRANITKKTEATERPKAIVALDSEILDTHPNDKVLVHTVSYGYAQQVYSMSRHKNRMITYDCARDRKVKLDEFKKAPPGAVLVASSMDRGVDLPDDQCRVVVVMKMPYLNRGDKQVNTRLHMKGGQLWYTVNAIRTLIQMTGRAMRSADDYCEIFILDAQFGRVYRENKYLFPEWWRAALKMPKP